MFLEIPTCLASAVLRFKVALFKKLLIIKSLFDIVGMVQFLSNELFFRFMSNCDYELLVPADMMERKVVPDGKKFSEWISWGTKFQVVLHKPSRAIFSEACRMPVLDAGG